MLNAKVFSKKVKLLYYKLFYRNAKIKQTRAEQSSEMMQTAVLVAIIIAVRNRQPMY